MDRGPLALRNTLLWLLISLLVFTGTASAAGQADDSQWQIIAPGIEYQKYQLPDPNNVFVVRMERNNPQVTLETSIAQGKLAEGKEAVSGMYARYDQALNFWGGNSNPPTWGMRNQVVVAINGSYFDIPTGVPQGGMVQSGWYAKRYDNLGGWGGFAWKLDRSAFISECLANAPDRQFITFPATGVTLPIADVNNRRRSDKLVIYTPQFNTHTGTDNTGVEVMVELTQPTMLFPKPAYISGIVREVLNDDNNSLIPFNYIVLSANGDAGRTLFANAQVGSEVRISQEITSFEKDCVSPYSLSWTKTYASIQGAFFFLKDGNIQDFSDPGAVRRNPRTAIAFNDQYIYFVVVDGRDYYHSIGMSINELALFVRDTLGANWGVAQDGGGSSTMVINGQVVNNTYCNLYTCAGYYTQFVPPTDLSNRVEVQTDQSSGSNIIVSSAGIERAVANGMMMVVILPEVHSYAFRPDDVVTTSYDTDMRLGPGTNYDAFTSIPKGTSGTVLEQMNGLSGILAKSSYWWYVSFGGVTGWVPQEALEDQGMELGLMGWFLPN